MKTIRIFISSPGDVKDERQCARQVVEQLRAQYAGKLELKALLWEDLALEASMSFQQGIDLMLSKEHGVDIAAFILWTGLCAGLARLLLAALPELSDGAGPDAGPLPALAEGLVKDAKLTVDLVVKPALSKARRASPPASRLILLIDQVEPSDQRPSRAGSMISQAAITHWRNVAHWPQDAQVEQDLILCRGLVQKWHALRQPPRRSPFARHIPMELTLLPIACIVLIAMGLPGALRGAIPGILSLVGAGGLVALLVIALRSTLQEPVSYDAFSASVFFFIVLLGASAGLFRAPAWLWTPAGAAAGYLLGLLAGLWNQKLGFLAFLPVLAARMGIVGLIVADLALLFGQR